jgi:hypothetical protein
VISLVFGTEFDFYIKVSKIIIMKKYLLLIGLIFLSGISFSQKISSLSPTMVVWKLNNEKVTLVQARYGVFMQDSLSIDIYFPKQTFDRMTNAENVKFEFRWYYYLSTRRSLMYVDKVDYNKSNSRNNVVVLHSSQQKLQPGWWEVQVVTTYDNGFLEIAETSKFQILVKK